MSACGGPIANLMDLVPREAVKQLLKKIFFAGKQHRWYESWQKTKMYLHNAPFLSNARPKFQDLEGSWLN